MLAYGFRHGVAHQLSCGAVTVAEQLLTDFGYCMARLALPSSGGGRPLAVDFCAIKVSHHL